MFLLSLLTSTAGPFVAGRRGGAFGPPVPIRGGGCCSSSYLGSASREPPLQASKRNFLERKTEISDVSAFHLDLFGRHLLQDNI